MIGLSKDVRDSLGVHLEDHTDDCFSSEDGEVGGRLEGAWRPRCVDICKSFGRYRTLAKYALDNKLFVCDFHSHTDSRAPILGF